MEKTIVISTYRNDYGYYVYNNTFFDTKQEIIQHATVNKDVSPDIKFIFHDHIYEKIDWSHEPEFTLDELYRMRAQQLRDNFDHLILMYSGGSDSHQVLNTFMKNNIHLDEIRSSFQPSLAQKYPFNSDSLDSFGLLNEYNSLLPWFKKIKNELRNTKLVIYDYTEDLSKINFDSFLSEFYLKHATHTSLIYSQMRIFLQTEKLIKDLQKIRNKKIAVIYGSDKPFFMIKNNKMFGYFVDTGRGGHVECLGYKDFNSAPYFPKMFFWTPDLPLIPIKQLHILKRAMQKSEKLKNMVYALGPFKMREQTIFKKIIYPDHDSTIYQSGLRPNPGEKIYTALFPEKNLMSVIQEKNNIIEKTLSSFNFDNMKSKYGISVRSKTYLIGDV
jgi:hypothetical protein